VVASHVDTAAVADVMVRSTTAVAGALHR